MGFQDGALAVFGRYGWLRWHGGSVGAVKVLPHRTQVGFAGAGLCWEAGKGGGTDKGPAAKDTGGLCWGKGVLGAGGRACSSVMLAMSFLALMSVNST